MSPGQNILELLTSLSEDDLRAFIPKGTLDIFDSLYPEASRPEYLRKLIVKTPITDLYDVGHLGFLVNFLSGEKLRELAVRLGVTGTISAAYLKEVAEQPSSKVALLEFFGFDPSLYKKPPDPLAPMHGEPKYGLFPHQLTLVQSLKQKLSYEPLSVVAHMPTGSGKTRTAMHFVCSHLRDNVPSVVIWLANSRELLEQAKNEFEKSWSFLGNRSVDIRPFWGNASDITLDLTDGVVFGSLQKLYSLKSNNLQKFLSLASRPTLLIVDEAHISVAPSYQEVINFLWKKYPNRKLIGLTATPGRTWADIDEDQRLSEMYGQKKVTLEIEGYPDPVTYLIENGYLAKPVFQLLNVSPGLKLSSKDKSVLSDQLEIPESVLERLGEDPQRNLKILKVTKDLLSRHKRVIVFMPSVSSAKQLATIMSLESEYQAAYISGDLDSRTRDRNIANFKNNQSQPKVLFNYGVLSAGFDAPQTSATVIARPTLSLVLYSQMVGRATRGVKAGGNEYAEIVTVVDPALPGFGKIEEAFRNWEDVWNG